MNIQEIASLIEIRRFLSGSIEDLSIKLSREEIKSVQNKIAALGKTIIERSLKLDLTFSDRQVEVVMKQFKFESTEDTKAVIEKFSPTVVVVTAPPDVVESK
jgi:hypothetical protein